MIARLEVDLDAIRSNRDAIAEFVAPAGFGAVIKANAYGHGLVETARALDGAVARFCVYEVGEAVALRDAGIAAPIFIMGPIPPADLDLAHACNAEITLWDTGAYARRVASVARRREAPFRIHAEIETGVTRTGIPPAQARVALEGYAATPEFRIAGIFSHLAAAEELDSDFTLVQLDRFNAALAVCAPALASLEPRPLRHIAASAAALLWPQTRLDLVRVGIALYGLWPSPETRARLGDALALRPALRWTTELVEVRDVPAETSVGYGRSYRTATPARIGVLPIGYAEGIPRLASNRGAVLIGGKRCAIVGRVCMNMTMVDVTAVPNAAPGAPVTLIGRDGGEELAAEDWARWAETIDYEIVARLPREIPRVFASQRNAVTAVARSIVPS
ncbi:MAG: alanine racemase [Candidatus Eremiobacteraeota bacterium]|nr:alanine racemase [Candidatus Eremiobacteraeota bacterium]